MRLRFGDKPAKYNIGRFRLAVTDAPHAKLDLPDPDRARLTAEIKSLEAAKKKYAAGIPIDDGHAGTGQASRHFRADPRRLSATWRTGVAGRSPSISAASGYERRREPGWIWRGGWSVARIH